MDLFDKENNHNDDKEYPLEADNNRSVNSPETSSSGSRSIITNSTKKISSDNETISSENDMSRGNTNYYFSCKYCSKKFSSKFALDNHTPGHKKSNRCSFCNRDFVSENYLQFHRLNKHGVTTDNKTLSLKCNMCEKKFKIQSDLIKHACSHKTLQHYFCNECPKAFITKIALLKHEQRHDVKHHRCSLCLKSFARKKMLQSHLKVHYTQTQINQ